MISIQIDIDRDQIEDAIVDTLGSTDHAGLIDMIVSVMERVGSPRAADDLIGKLNKTYIYLQETFGD